MKDEYCIADAEAVVWRGHYSYLQQLFRSPCFQTTQRIEVVKILKIPGSGEELELKQRPITY